MVLKVEETITVVKFVRRLMEELWQNTFTFGFGSEHAHQNERGKDAWSFRRKMMMAKLRPFL